MSPWVGNLASISPSQNGMEWHIGFWSLAFTDYIVLVSRSRPGLQAAIKVLLDEAEGLGLQPGLRKCRTMGICVTRCLWYTDHRGFTYEGGDLPVIGPDGFYKYLGVSVGCALADKGRLLPVKLQDSLNRLHRAPFKPQQTLGV